MNITIGKENCINDTIILIDTSLDDIRTKLQNTFANQDYDNMIVQIERLKLCTKDLDDMVHELKHYKSYSEPKEDGQIPTCENCSSENIEFSHNKNDVDMMFCNDCKHNFEASLR